MISAKSIMGKPSILLNLLQCEEDGMAFLHSGVLYLPVPDGAALGVEVDAHLHDGQS